ncbi:Ser/Thr protein phosphatase, putative [Trichomonas vaginalis G3]|uniref:Serine/threonine-protein phosphatase n=1 Tax=Trichomonas vaginalis (strain ATCC PRA-98 / G3) TaxID=412133 RepID=A2EFI2_TRIV3|nr:phosphoprotein phosphatase protein [Trichomonas vaginalis G3]EAY08576.1 Ser/Thr protein phosphatase, putative [Trichomonas vaginalis G3]KAI5497873.1 phosphoprotein phosphatase protein [Trichomonas vaginalis G3]|eukprot:XP_001320799.1 Ser/Thr protein phosphatase [Trichomonas vaginalis G3]
MYSEAFTYYLPFLRSTCPDFSLIGTPGLPIPKFDSNFVANLARSVKTIFATEPSCLVINTSVVVVGDLHGNFIDLCRIIAHAGMPKDTTYLFLGDYVDRGQYSTDVVILLFILKYTYPDKVFMLRGNHEFQTMNFYYGFYNEVLANYNKDVYTSINDAFTYLSYSAIIGGNTFAVHGGLSPLFTSLNDVKYISKPVLDSEIEKPESLIADILWSDPSCDDTEFSDSFRGHGKIFGKKVITKFLETTKMKRIVRAHQCVLNGHETLHDGKIITVFSSSAYNDVKSNKSAILIMNANDTQEIVTFDTIRTVTRDKAVFYPVGDSAPRCTKLHIIGQPKRPPIRASFSTVGINKNLGVSPTMRMLTMKPKLVRRVSAPME